ncbi:hypothetical protein [Pseudomonas sp. BN411]|uniref:hypothetical protein n=1 Tax=Pseudomonas sp. BN411 TaxID=2567887 RepID=UPI002455CBB0|nr:hypothetical protein [Pseudomonas sp. BN411]
MGIKEKELGKGAFYCTPLGWTRHVVGANSFAMGGEAAPRKSIGQANGLLSD